MQEHPHTTRQLLWEEYRAIHPDGVGYSRFCYLYQSWKQQQDVVLRQEHCPGEKLFVDWAVAKVPIHDPQAEEVHQASLFVAGLSEPALRPMPKRPGINRWFPGSVPMCVPSKFLGGCPQLVAPDNAKTGVLKACRYEPDLNPTYQEIALHYGIGMLPTRPRKPRDKAKVEVGVQNAQCWIVAVLRLCKFFSLGELNHVIAELLEKLNQRPFQKREVHGTACLLPSTNRLCVRCPTNALIPLCGPRRPLTSTITLRSTRASIASPIP